LSFDVPPHIFSFRRKSTRNVDGQRTVEAGSGRNYDASNVGDGSGRNFDASNADAFDDGIGTRR
jgi:hypothetical protein